jgi:hypothetical protein
MRSLEGKDDSYKESKGANLEYAFPKEIASCCFLWRIYISSGY